VAANDGPEDPRTLIEVPKVNPPGLPAGTHLRLLPPLASSTTGALALGLASAGDQRTNRSAACTRTRGKRCQGFKRLWRSPPRGTARWWLMGCSRHERCRQMAVQLTKGHLTLITAAFDNFWLHLDRCSTPTLMASSSIVARYLTLVVNELRELTRFIHYLQGAPFSFWLHLDICRDAVKIDHHHAVQIEQMSPLGGRVQSWARWRHA